MYDTVTGQIVQTIMTELNLLGFVKPLKVGKSKNLFPSFFTWMICLKCNAQAVGYQSAFDIVMTMPVFFKMFGSANFIM
jgi:hypothetical protein